MASSKHLSYKSPSHPACVRALSNYGLYLHPVSVSMFLMLFVSSFLLFASWVLEPLGPSDFATLLALAFVPCAFLVNFVCRRPDRAPGARVLGWMPCHWPTTQRCCHGYHVAFSCCVSNVTWIQKLRRDASGSTAVPSTLVVIDVKENACSDATALPLPTSATYINICSAVLFHLNTFWTALVRMFCLVFSNIPHLPLRKLRWNETWYVFVIASPPSNPPSVPSDVLVPFRSAFSWHFASFCQVWNLGLEGIEALSTALSDAKTVPCLHALCQCIGFDSWNSDAHNSLKSRFLCSGSKTWRPAASHISHHAPRQEAHGTCFVTMGLRVKVPGNLSNDCTSQRVLRVM